MQTIPDAPEAGYNGLREHTEGLPADAYLLRQR